jgi:hypothetical protein
MGMRKIGRIDRVIASLLLALLLGLLGLALSNRSDPGRSAPPDLTSPASASSSGSGPAAGATTTPPSPTGARTGSTGTAPLVSGSSPAGSVPSSTAPVPVAGPVSAVGDSIMLDIQPDLQAIIPGVQVDGLVSRQFETGIGVVQAERAAGTLGTVLVVELGTNGSVTPSDFDAMMQAAAGVKRVVFVNINVPRSWMAPDNAVLAAGVARYPGVAVLADWNGLSSGHPEWFTPDQVHLQPAGAQAMADLVAAYA